MFVSHDRWNYWRTEWVLTKSHEILPRGFCPVTSGEHLPVTQVWVCLPGNLPWWILISSMTTQCMTLNIFKECHSGYLNLKIYSPIEFCLGHIFQWYWKKLGSFNSHVGYEIFRSHSPKEFSIALDIGQLLKVKTDHCKQMALLASLHSQNIMLLPRIVHIFTMHVPLPCKYQAPPVGAGTSVLGWGVE